MTGRSHGKERFDVIVVLGAAVGVDGGPSAALRRRVAEGVRRLEAGAAPVLLLSGGKGGGPDGGKAGGTGGAKDGRWPSEAEVMRDLALAAGVAAGGTAGAPEGRLVLETDSRSTLENARCSARIMRARGWTKALVVTDAVHLPRALMAFRALGIEAKGAAVMGGARDAPVWTWPASARTRRTPICWKTSQSPIPLPSKSTAHSACRPMSSPAAGQPSSKCSFLPTMRPAKYTPI